MKKILLFIFGILLLNSCAEHPANNTNALPTNTLPTEFLMINNCKYYKIKIGNHDAYQYRFHTYYGRGSDIIHFDDMCDYCKQKNVK